MSEPRPFTYVTEYDKPDGRYGGTIDARSIVEARRLAEERGLGERVVGILGAVVTSDGQLMEDKRVTEGRDE